MKYILVYLLLTGFSYANTSLDQEYANIENKFAIKETELLQWFSNSVEGINHNSQNKIKLTYDKISDEKDRKEELKLQKSKINIENEQNIFLKKSDLRGLNRENQRIDIYYNRYPNESRDKLSGAHLPDALQKLMNYPRIIYHCHNISNVSILSR